MWRQPREPRGEPWEVVDLFSGARYLLPMLGAVVFFVIGGLLLLASLGYFIWRRNSGSASLGGKPDVVNS